MIGPIRWGAMDGRTPVEVTHVGLSLARLPEAFDGFRIAVISDLHFGRYVRATFVRRVIHLARQDKPHLVLLCGDMLSRSNPFAPILGELLAGLVGEVRTLAVLGNHEHDLRAAGSRPPLEGVGVDFLVNEHRLLGPGAGPPAPGKPVIAIAGVDDLRGGNPDFHAALSGIAPGTCTILAGHRPDLADLVDRRFTVDLMLCGHTHGGQVRIFGWPPVTETHNRRYVSGLVTGPGFPIYISRGLGVVGIPLRVACDPELPIITLRASQAPR
jgi:predicted MPP superfamily phosphohydrolase